MAIKKNLWIFFQKNDFIRKIEPFHLRMRHIIQMTTTAGLTVPHSMNPIFQYIFDCLSFNLVCGNFDFVFQGLNRLWMFGVILIFNGYPQKIVQRGQITAPRRPIDIRVSADYSIFEKLVEHGTVTLAIDHNGGSLLIFEEKWPNDAIVSKSAPNSHSLCVHRLLNDGAWIF